MCTRCDNSCSANFASFLGSQVSSFDFSLLNTSLPHDLLKLKVLSLVNWCFNRESKTYLSISNKAVFLATRNMTVWHSLSFVKLWLSSCIRYMYNLKAWYIIKYWGLLWAQTAPLIADLFLWEGFNVSSSQIYTAWPYGYVWRYLGDILFIDNPEFEKNMSDVYPT